MSIGTAHAHRALMKISASFNRAQRKLDYLAERRFPAEVKRGRREYKKNRLLNPPMYSTNLAARAFSNGYWAAAWGDVFKKGKRR